MKLTKTLSAILAGSILLGACGNTVYGPRRLIYTGLIDDGDKSERACPAPGGDRTVGSPISLSFEFYDSACRSLAAPGDSALGRAMIDPGVTLTRVRCADFFAERSANQMRQRVLRGGVAPVSALITGIIGVSSFTTDADRQEAIQILGIGQSATTAGLDLYESEFLFASENVNSVRILVMRALDEHAARIIAENVGFYGAARHLIDHQMICTPANILALTQAAIREGRVTRGANTADMRSALAGENDRTVIANLSQSLRSTGLSGDQAGSMWWLAELARAGGAPDQNALAIIQSRLSDLPVNPVTGSAGALTIDRPLVSALEPVIRTLSPSITAGFEVTRRMVSAEIAKPAPPALLERTRPVAFTLPAGVAPEPSRAQEVGIVPAAGA